MYRKLLIVLSLLVVLLCSCESDEHVHTDADLVKAITYSSDYGDTIHFTIPEDRYLYLLDEDPIQVVDGEYIIMGFSVDNGELWPTYVMTIEDQPLVDNVQYGYWKTWPCIYYDYWEDDYEATSHNAVILVGNTLLLSSSFANENTVEIVKDIIDISLE